MPRKIIKFDISQIRGEVRDYILTNFLPRENPDTLRDNDLLFESGIIDSAGAMTLIAFIEERYGLHIPDEDLFPENFATVKKAVAYISAKRNGSRSTKVLRMKP